MSRYICFKEKSSEGSTSLVALDLAEVQLITVSQPPHGTKKITLVLRGQAEGVVINVGGDQGQAVIDTLLSTWQKHLEGRLS